MQRHRNRAETLEIIKPEKQKSLVEQQGEALLCFRYRYDAKARSLFIL